MRPGIVLVWGGLWASVVSLFLGAVPFDALALFTGVFSIFIAIALYALGSVFAGLGLIFALWGFIVTAVHRTGAHILASVGLLLSVLAAARVLATWWPAFHKLAP
jgi:hypothetical protein